MIELIDYARIASDVYHNSPSKIKGWNRITNNDFSPSTHPSADFYAALYLNFINGKASEAVIAIRGTVPKKLNNVYVDIISWYSSAIGSGQHDSLPDYFGLAMCFVNKALNYLKKYFPDVKNISYTGHSLGGAIAQLLALRYHPFNAVVFNSPGCLELAGPKVAQRAKFITSVNSHYGIINKIGKLILGKLTIVDVPNMAAEAKAMYESFSRGDFNKGKTYAQMADNPHTSFFQSIEDTALSTYYHIDAVANTVSSVAKVPSVSNQLHQCTTLAWSGLTGYLQKAGCDVGTLVDNYADVILAQHSIDNMVAALSNPKNIHTVNTEHKTV